MKKLLLLLLTCLMLLTMTSCGEKEITANDVADSIADISADEDGNVTISLVNGKSFSLGNLKGEKGDKGDKGDPGADGTNGKNGTNGINGTNGSDGKDGQITSKYVSSVTEYDDNKFKITYSDGTEIITDRYEHAGEYQITLNFDLYDEMNNLISTVTDYAYFGKNDTIFKYTGREILFNNLYYVFNCDKYFDGCECDENILRYEGIKGGESTIWSIYFNIMSYQDTTINIEYILAHKATETWHLNGDVINTRQSIYKKGDTFCFGPGTVIECDDTLYVSNCTNIVETMGSEDVHKDVTFSLAKSSTTFNNSKYLSFDDIKTSCLAGCSTFDEFVENVKKYFNDNGFVNVSYDIDEVGQNLDTLELKMEYNVSEYSSSTNDFTRNTSESSYGNNFYSLQFPFTVVISND